MSLTLRASWVVTDIEGTTSSIAFVHETLFPYADRALEGFVARRPDDAEPYLAGARALANAPHLTTAETIALLRQWIAQDRKATPLKALQGLVWAEGYAAGELVGHIYEDAAAGLVRWRQAGVKLAVYSSGSITAQKLIFGHTEFGDLTKLFSAYFDTTTGPKRDAASYRAIAATLDAPAGDILFLSDHPDEIAAATQAGFQVCRVVRDAGLVAPGEVATFDDILLEAKP